ncbi:hypothetical protein QUF61_05945 [Candidatus Venteria ishoeyi]|uniref:hypothetical protein n=1 Tax=Candidatus Venteria ishoeyi TaxID=1899563 RepID=UPI0025A61A11|nr:hypothetical protein [Candidatus Venteria ishoeyi]MDM8546016.1 hypothetical protein [Candidatus Venteria ishoeyi]
MASFSRYAAENRQKLMLVFDRYGVEFGFQLFHKHYASENCGNSAWYNRGNKY